MNHLSRQARHEQIERQHVRGLTSLDLHIDIQQAALELVISSLRRKKDAPRVLYSTRAVLY